MPQTDRRVLTALRAQLGEVSHQAISQRRNRIQKDVPMLPDIATYVIAQQEGVRIERMLDADTLQRVADFQARLAAKSNGSRDRPRPPSARKRPSLTKQLVMGSTPIPAGALTPKHVQEAERMAKVYPLLYVLEN